MGTRRGRLTGFLAALTLTAWLLTATAAPASAGDPHCNQAGPRPHNSCIRIDREPGTTLWTVRVGFDGYLSKPHADGLLQLCPGGPQIFAELWGRRAGRNNIHLGYLSLVGPPASGVNPTGLFADFIATGMNLNHNIGMDNVYAEITYRDCFYDAWFTHGTGVISDYL
jgi:hypothetical protein